MCGCTWNENYVDNLERPRHCFRHTFPNFDGGTSTGMMTSSTHLSLVIIPVEVPPSKIVFHFSLYRDPFKIALKYLKNNLFRPFENCEFTPLRILYRITKLYIYKCFRFDTSFYRKRKYTDAHYSVCVIKCQVWFGFETQASNYK